MSTRRRRSLTEENPRGNIALLAYKAIERIAQRHTSEDEWAVLGPLIERALMQQRQERKRR